jgi:luciferase family oxidoreductase group 1
MPLRVGGRAWFDTPVMPRLSVLDQSATARDRPQGAAIRETMALARHCEALGYHRFWVSEHHAAPSFAGTAPEILVSALAATTRSIRVGSGGVMLPHYSPFKVAEQFRVLDAIAPGRIDLGLGRAPGGDGRTAFALNPLANHRAAHFPDDVRDLMAWVRGAELAPGHPFARLRAQPMGETAPHVWMLGSSDFGARLAAELGLPYAYAWFFTDGRGADQALSLYHEHFRPSETCPEPCAALCVWALAADTEAEAQHLFSTRALWRVFRDRGEFRPMIPPDEAEAFDIDPQGAERMAQLRETTCIGTGETVWRQITALAERYTAQELLVVTWTYEAAARERSYALIAEAAGLARAAA